MASFDNGTLQSGVYTQVKQFGPVLRGYGPPVPEAGVVGDLYLDVQTWFLYEKRSASGGQNPWGNYLFQVAAAYRNTLKWFSAYPPANDVGIYGDYCLHWSGYTNYGMQPAFYGPKQITGWAENGTGPDTVVDPLYAGYALPVGLLDESTPVAFSSSTQIVVVGVIDEYILAVPVPLTAGVSISEIGAASGPALTSVSINPLYTAENEHSV